MASHPDQQQVSYVLQGLQHGFRLGFHSAHKLKPAKRNKPSARHHAHIVDAYLASEVSLGRVAGPFASPPFPRLHISSFGVIPKKGQTGKGRLIVDLSSQGVLVLTTALILRIFLSSILRLIKLFVWSPVMAQVPLWQNLTWNPLIGTSQFIQMTASYWARGGVVSSTLTSCFLSISVLHHLFSIP